MPIGLTVLVAPPKIGKSWLGQQIEHHVSAGRPFLGLPCPPQVRSLVIDLEGDRYLTRERSLHLVPGPGNFSAIEYVHADHLPDGGFAERLVWLERLMIDMAAMGCPVGHVRIDTLGDFLGPKHRDENAYEAAKARCTALNRLAHRHGVSIIALHHTISGGAMSGDPYDVMNGSTGGIMGGSAAAWLLERAQRGDEGVLRGVGRSVQDFEHALVFRSGRWELTDEITPEQARHAGNPRTILDDLYAHPGSTSNDIAARTGLTTATVRRDLSRLSGQEEVRKSGDRWYLVSQLDDGAPAAGEGERALPAAGTSSVDLGGGVVDVDEDQADERRWSTRAIEQLRTSIVGSRRREKPIWRVPVDERTDPRWAAAELADQGTGRHAFVAPVDPSIDGDRPVVVLDRNGSYPSACSNVPVVATRLRHHWHTDDGTVMVHEQIDKLAGVFRVSWGWEGWDPAAPHPAGILGEAAGTAPDDVGVWVTAPTWRLLRKVGVGPRLLEAHYGPATTSLFTPFSSWVRDRRADTWGTDDYGEVKRATSQALRMLFCTKPDSPFWRPDWHAAILAEANARHWAKAAQAAADGWRILALRNVDEVALLLEAAHVPDLERGRIPLELPYKLGERFGEVKVKGWCTYEGWVSGGRKLPG